MTPMQSGPTSRMPKLRAKLDEIAIVLAPGAPWSAPPDVTTRAADPLARTRAQTPATS